MNFKQFLKDSLDNENIEATEIELKKCEVYKELLLAWNQNINLTSITDELPMAEKHFFDSIMMSKYIDLNHKKVIDIGTGAGFPGLPLRIMDDTIDLTLLDSLNKRLNFLKEVGQNLDLFNVKYLHGRAEDFSKKSEFREAYDIATSRAVARLNVLAEYCLPYVKLGGYFVALKGKECKEEIIEAKNAIDLLGGKVIETQKYELKHDGSYHYLVVVEKISHTPNKFPRKAGMPTKSPL